MLYCITVKSIGKIKIIVLNKVDKENTTLTLASPNTIWVSPAGLLYTSGLFITNNIFFDLRIVTRVTPDTTLSPNLDIALRAFFSLLLCLALLTGSSCKPAAANASDVRTASSALSNSGTSSSLSLSVSDVAVTAPKVNK